MIKKPTQTIALYNTVAYGVWGFLMIAGYNFTILMETEMDGDR